MGKLLQAELKMTSSLLPAVCPFKTSPCVRSKRPRVCRHHAHMLKNVSAWCWYTRGRSEWTHGEGRREGRVEWTHHTATAPRQRTQRTQLHTQPRPQPQPTTQGHTVEGNGVRGVKMGKPQVTGSWKAAKLRSTHTHHTPQATSQAESHRTRPNRSTTSRADEPSKAKPEWATPHHAKSRYAKNRPGRSKPGR